MNEPPMMAPWRSLKLNDGLISLSFNLSSPLLFFMQTEIAY